MRQGAESSLASLPAGRTNPLTHLLLTRQTEPPSRSDQVCKGLAKEIQKRSMSINPQKHSRTTMSNQAWLT